MDSPNGGAQRLEPLRDRRGGVVQQALELRILRHGRADGSLAHLHRRRYQILLRPVVQIAFDATPFHLVGINDRATGSGEFRDGLGGSGLVAGLACASSEPHTVTLLRTVERKGSAGSTLEFALGLWEKRLPGTGMDS